MNMEKTVYVFNKFYTSFIKDVKKNGNDEIKSKIKKNYKAIDKLSAEYIQFFLDSFKGEDSKFNFVDESRIVMKDIKTSDVLASLESDNDKDTYWNYIYILASLALVYNESLAEDADEESVGILAQSVLEVLVKKQKGNDVSDDISTILQDDIQELLTKIKHVKIDDVPTVKPEDGGESNPFMNMFKGMEDSKICNLAQEISNDIDVSNLKIDSSEDIMKLLDFSNSNNVMGDIIKKVSSKMHEKISNGEIKQEELLGEAISMMGKMSGGAGGMGGLGGLASMFNNPMMSEMMKMASKGKAKPKPDAFRQSSTRDRMRKKLEERRKASEQKK